MAVFIIRRETKAKEPRFHVRVQTARGQPQVHLGAFKVRKLAEARKAWAERELAAGRWPDLRNLQPVQVRTVEQACADWLASRLDASAGSLRAYGVRVAPIVEHLGHLDPLRVSRIEVQGFVVTLAESYAPSTLTAIMVVLGQVLDHAGAEPNPVRDRRVKRPRRKRQQMILPTRADLAALEAELPEKYRAPLRLLEASGLRVGELEALVWADVDHARGRLLVRDAKTDAGVRFVALPAEALPWGGGEGRVFEGFVAGAFRSAIARACERAGLPRFHPHDLRHLWCSRRLHGGDSPALIAAEAGHASPAVLLGTYSHVVPPD